MKNIEKKLDWWLVKKAPFQLPNAVRKSLAEFLPWFGIVAGLFMLLMAGDMYRTVTQVAGPIVSDGIYSAPILNGFKPALWASLLLLLAQALVLIFAFPGLRSHKKSGWNMLLAVVVLNFAYNVSSYFLYYVQLAALFYSLIGTVAMLYVLFQVRGYFMGRRLGRPRARSAAKVRVVAAKHKA